MASAAAARNVRYLCALRPGRQARWRAGIVHKGHAFIGHMFSDGFSVVDVRDPLKPKTVAFVAAPKNTRSHHLQIHGDVLLAVNGPNIWAMQQYATQQDYYAKSLIDSVQTEQPFAAGLRVFDISKPASPREIAFLTMPGFGAHRIWWVGGRYAYVSVHFEGFIDHALAVIDVSNPAKPQLAGRWWLPGMNRAGGETPPASFGKRTALHHLISAGNLGYAAWRDGGFTIHDLSDPHKSEIDQPPQLCAALRRRRAYAVAAAGPQASGAGRRGNLGELRQRVGLHLADRCARAVKSRFRSRRLPTPAEEDFCAKGAKFGPHNLHENRPGSMQTEDLIFATYHNAGLRILRYPQCRSNQDRSAISCRRRRKESSTSGRTRPRSSSPATCSSIRTA